jgi:hypothetical protein
MNVGFLLIADSVSSMRRDPINLEDRIVYKIKNTYNSYTIMGRMVYGKDSSNAASIFRRKFLDHKEFSQQFDVANCYIMLGNSERRFNSNIHWFKQTIINVVNESTLAGYNPVLIVCNNISPVKSNRERISQRVVRVAKRRNWFEDCKSVFLDIKEDKSVKVLECEINCPKQWDTPDMNSIDILSSLVAEDISSGIRPKEPIRKKHKESAVVFSFSNT